MKASAANFMQFLSGKHQFIIPIYQRTYSWTNAQCVQLWNDIVRVATNPQIPGHFIGSIVYIQDGIYVGSAIQQLLVIDGQQRLTTLSILLAALGQAIKKSGRDLQITQKKIQNYYLLNSDEENELRYKLLLTHSDKETLMRLSAGEDFPAQPSQRIVENYEYFVRQIHDSQVDLETIYNGLSKLIIVDVSLDRTQDNPQLIFESMNSTGLELSQADLIRNFILMGLEPKEQNDLYNLFWYPMEQSFGRAEYSSHFDRFMRDYLTIQFGGRIPRILEVYLEFKTHIRAKASINMREIVSDISRYAKYYVKLVFLREEDVDVRTVLREINALKVDVAYPFLLQVMDDYVQSRITRDELLMILRNIESYVFRRGICGIPTNSLNKTFATLYRSIEPSNYLVSFQAALLTKDSYRRFPGDEEFVEQLKIKDVYNFRSRNYLLRKLENAMRTRELVEIEQYTIEHILPQNKDLSAAWKKELGEKWQDVQGKYLHTIGNLTLTGYNSEYSDRPFAEKRDYPEKGFHDSPLHLNRGLAKLDHWNEQTIQVRAGKLAEQALKIWAMPALSEQALEKYKERIAERDDDEHQYALENYEYLQGQMLELFKTFSHRVLNMNSSVREEYKKFYIAFKASTNFVDIVPQKSRLRLSLNIPFDEIDDPKGMCKDVSQVGRRGNGDTEVGLESLNQIDYIMSLVQQAYDWQEDE